MQFGHIEGIKVGDTFESRKELADAGSLRIDRIIYEIISSVLLSTITGFS